MEVGFLDFMRRSGKLSTIPNRAGVLRIDFSESIPTSYADSGLVPLDEHPERFAKHTERVAALLVELSELEDKD